MLRVGIVGLGFMGWIHWLVYKRVPGIEVVAICEQDPVRRTGDWRSIRGNFGPPGEQVDLAKIRVFDSLDAMLEEGGLDLVDICLPPSLHSEAVLKSFDAGNHVFCEKPLALNVADCEAMVARAKQVVRRLLVGHVLPFFPEYSLARQTVQSGKYGRLLGGNFRRVISDPTWLKFL
jgi:predicted dehydrogenase